MKSAAVAAGLSALAILVSAGCSSASGSGASQAASAGSTAIVGTNRSPAYFTPTATAAGTAASMNTGQRNPDVRTPIHAARASSDRQVAS